MELYLIRHGETAWSTQARYTGRSDVALTARGRLEAAAAKEILRSMAGSLSGFTTVAVSPLRRALETCDLIFGSSAEPLVTNLLQEIDFGEFEGLTRSQAQRLRPGWDIWLQGAPGGESVEQLGRRAQQFLADHEPDRLAVIAHGYILRAIAMSAVGLDTRAGRLLVCGTGSVSLITDRAGRVAVEHWNQCAWPRISG